MSRVELQFDGNSRGAVISADQTAAAIAKVKLAGQETEQAAAVQARENITRRALERRSLEELVVQYKTVAANAVKGSEVQIAAAKLEEQAIRELNTTHGVYVRTSRASTASLAAGGKEMEKFSKGAIVGSGLMGRFSRSLALASGGFLGGLGLIAVMKGAVTQGASLQTQLERTDITFSKSGAGIKEWSKTSAEAMNLTRAAALDAVNTIGKLLQNMGVQEAQAAALSTSLIQRAADVSAITGKDPQSVLAAFEAGVQGRTRSLKQLGIAIDTVQIKQEAERLGLAKNTVDLGKVRDAEIAVAVARHKAADAAAKHGPKSVEEAQALLRVDTAERQLAKAQQGHAEALTAEQKALATTSLLMQQSAKDAGGVADRHKTLAGQTALLKAEIGDLQEELGTALIPQLTKYLPMVTGWIDRNEKNGNLQRDFNKAAKDAGDILGTVVGVVKTAKHWFDLLGDTVGGDKHLVELLVGSFTAFKAGGLVVSAAQGAIGVLGKIGAAAEKAAAKVALIGEAAATDAEEVTAAAGTIEADNAAIAGSAEAAAGAEAGVGAGAAAGAATAGAGVGAAIVGGAILTGGAVGLLSKLFGAGDTQLATVNGGALVFTHGKFIFRQRGASQPVDAQTAFDLLSQPDARLTKKGQQALDKMLGAQGAPTGANDDLAAKLTHAAGANGGRVPGASGPITPGLAMLEQLTGGHVNDDFATSGHAHDSYHYLGEAADLAPDPTVWAKLFAHKEAFAELFGPWGLFHYGVQFYDPKLQAQHENHIHVAYTGTPSKLDEVFKGGGATTTTTAGGAGAGVPAGGFVEIPKAKKVHLTPLQRAVASGVKSISDDVAAINDDVAKNALPASLGAYLDQRAKQIQKALAAATDPAKIKQQVADFKKLMQDALRLPADAARMQKDIATWQAAVKKGLLPVSLEKDLEARALAINAKLGHDLNNPTAFKADERAIHQIEQTATLYLTAARDALADRSKLSAIATSFAEGISAALGRVPTMTEGQVAGVKVELDRITARLANPKGLTKADIAALQRRFSELTQVYQNGLSQLQTELQDAKSTLETDWQRMENSALTQFDQETQDHLSAMQAAAAKALAKIRVLVSGTGFGSFQFGQGDQTPTEKLIAKLTQAHDDAAAQAQLAADKAAGNTQAVAEDEYQMQLTQLGRKAQAERDAADKQLQAAQDAFSKREQLAEVEYQRERDDQRTHLEDMFNDYLAAVESGKMPLSQALAALGDATGGALAAAFIAQVESAYAAMQQFAYDAYLLAGEPAGVAASQVGLLKGPSLGGPGSPKLPPGYANGGWAGYGVRTIDPRDTIMARLRPGEYVMSPEEVAAGKPRWAGDGGATHHHYHVTLAGPVFETRREVEDAVALMSQNGGTRVKLIPMRR